MVKLTNERVTELLDFNSDLFLHVSMTAQEGRSLLEEVKELRECRYCANTGWFYGDPGLGQFCGCDYGILRESITKELAAPPAPVSKVITPEMVERALKAWPPNGRPYIARDVMRDALIAALEGS